MFQILLNLVEICYILENLKKHIEGVIFLDTQNKETVHQVYVNINLCLWPLTIDDSCKFISIRGGAILTRFKVDEPESEKCLKALNYLCALVHVRFLCVNWRGWELENLPSILVYLFCTQAVIFSIVAECDTFFIYMYISVGCSNDATQCDLHNKTTFKINLLHE